MRPKLTNSLSPTSAAPLPKIPPAAFPTPSSSFQKFTLPHVGVLEPSSSSILLNDFVKVV
jgi:hypothetical protein